MRRTLPLFIAEPSGRGTRRRLSGALLGLGAQPSLQELKKQLREMRELCLTEQKSLVAEFRLEVSLYPRTDCLSARDGAEAAGFIRRIAQDSKNIVVNRSSSVVNELKPHLLDLGFQVLEPYHSELGSFENRVGDYWELPALLTKGLTSDFELHNFNTSLELHVDPERAKKDCIAVLGVSAACAQDGSVFFLQHSSNISKTLEQAGEVVLIVSIDKVVKTREHAALQTKGMGIFGLEAMLLNLRQRENTGASLDSLPLSVRASDQRWHVILLDNGRSRILSNGLQELLLCIGCKACVVQCPINHSMGRNGAVWSPRDHLFMFLLGQNPLMDTCLHCEACRVECPLSVDLPKLMWMARADHAAKHGRSLRDRLLGNTEIVAKMGTFAAPVSNTVVNLKPAKTLISAGLGFDSKRSLPTFHRETFVQWLAHNKRDATGEAEAKTGRVAYFVGCFANYYQPELAKAVVNVLKKNGLEVAVPSHQCCGMPMIASKNMRGFRRNAEGNIRSLAAFVMSGWEVVTSCPSCALMIKREYPSLCGPNEASLVSEHVHYLDEYLVRLGREGRLARDMVRINESVLCHIPCHLKVQDDGRSTLELLQAIPGLSVAAVNATCCGMGGYHGYKKAYSRLSMEIGRRLFGDIKEAGIDKVITSCAACKLQIGHGTGITAIHPVQLLEMAYGPDHQGNAGGMKK